jgi:hypothetical protein
MDVPGKEKGGLVAQGGELDLIPRADRDGGGEGSAEEKTKEDLGQMEIPANAKGGTEGGGGETQGSQIEGQGLGLPSGEPKEASQESRPKVQWDPENGLYIEEKCGLHLFEFFDILWGNFPGFLA